MTKRIASRATRWGPIAVAALLLPEPSSADSYRFRIELFSLPGDGQIIGRGINDANDLVGDVDHFGSGSRKPTGFVRRGDDVRLIDFPGSEPLNGTLGSGINNAGQIVGRFSEASRGIQTHGYTLEDGVFRQFDVPGSTFTEAFDVNNHGVIVGRTFLAADPGFPIGTAFIRDGDAYAFFRPPGVRGPFGIAFHGLNDRGDAVGQVLDDTGFRAFAVVDGAYTPFSISGSSRTVAWGISNANQIVGWFDDASGTHGFLMDASGIYRIDVPAEGSDETFLTGINENGFVVGAVGFRRFPVREVLVGSPCDEPGDGCLEAPRIGDPAVDLASTVAIDVKPHSELNPVRLPGRGLISVAILGSDVFDVGAVDSSALAFGPDGAAPVHKLRGRRIDVNGDGFADLIFRYRTEETGIELGDADACVRGRMLDGRPIRGCDAIQTVRGCRAGFPPRCQRR